MSSRPATRIVLAALALVGVAAVALLALSGDGGTEGSGSRAAGPRVERVGSARARVGVLVAAGDISRCDSTGDSGTGALVRRLSGTVQLLGDTAYPDGTLDEYRRCYGPAWGSFRSRTMPATGNHDYAASSSASGYFSYFARAARPPAGYYSYNLARWHVVVLNSNCGFVGGCAADSAQGRWLKADLARSRARCTVAIWHQARFSSGRLHGSSDATSELWRLLRERGAEVVLNAHEHNYERFAPQDEDGKPDPAGLREFVVGTGGASRYPFRAAPQANSQRRRAGVYGVLRLELRPRSYRWRFIRSAGPRFSDSGSAVCR